MSFHDALQIRAINFHVVLDDNVFYLIVVDVEGEAG